VMMKRGLGPPKRFLPASGETAKTVKEHEAEIEEEQNHENEEFHDVTGLIEFADPQTVSKAVSSPEAADWKKAMNAE
jgi:hypothetical protein